MPLHFTLHRGDELVQHQQQILSDETVNLTERVSQMPTDLDIVQHYQYKPLH